MKRDTILGYDPSENKVFVFLFGEDALKELTIMADYLDDEQLKKAQQALVMYAFIWKTGASVEDMKAIVNDSHAIYNITFEVT